MIDELVTKYSNQNVAELTNSEKVNLLISQNILANPSDFEDEIIKETLKSVINVKEIQTKNGERGMHRYIISNSDTVEDVMNVFALFKVCGYQDEDINIDIVPLFETMEGLANAEKVMQDLYNDEVYQKHLAKRKNEQTIMLGFSDGTKDGGYLKANWEIYATKERLSKISEENDVKVKIGRAHV